MRVVVLTNAGSLFGLKLLNALRRQGIVPAAIVVVDQPLRYFWALFRGVRRRVGLADAVYFTLARVWHGMTTRPPRTWGAAPFLADYASFGAAVTKVRGTNTPETVDVLQECAPDLLLLGQTGIVREPVLSVPRAGTLNAHPGMLPDYRGIDCARWAVHAGEFDKIGASVHWVNAGVDTGAVVATRAYEIRGDEDLAQLDDRLDDLAVTLMAEVVAEIGHTGAIPEGRPQAPDAGQQYYKMPRALEAEARATLRARAAAGRQ